MLWTDAYHNNDFHQSSWPSRPPPPPPPIVQGTQSKKHTNKNKQNKKATHSVYTMKRHRYIHTHTHTKQKKKQKQLKDEKQGKQKRKQRKLWSHYLAARGRGAERWLEKYQQTASGHCSSGRNDSDIVLHEHRSAVHGRYVNKIYAQQWMMNKSWKCDTTTSQQSLANERQGGINQVKATTNFSGYWNTHWQPSNS